MSDATIDLLGSIPGGEQLLAWFSGAPGFGDAEMFSLRLERDGDSSLTLKLLNAGRAARVTFVLGHWIDVSIRGFCGQNVMNALTLERADERVMEPWELGVSARPGELEIKLHPCFGAYGSVRANVKAVRLEAEGD